MKVLLFASLVTVCACARLDNTYLPPPGAAHSGGGPGLSAPSFGRPGGAAPSGGGGGGHGGGGGGGGFGGGAPSGPQEPPIAILSFENVHNEDGSYRYSYETANGIKVEEEGEIKNKGTENEILSVRGSYSYTAPDGTPITVTYIADENGFQPQGDHLPQAPEAPAPQGSAPGGGGGGGYPSGPAGGGGGGGGYPSGGGGGYPGGGSAQPQRPSNQYIPPANKPPSRGPGNGAFSPQSGYRY